MAGSCIERMNAGKRARIPDQRPAEITLDHPTHLSASSQQPAGMPPSDWARSVERLLERFHVRSEREPETGARPDGSRDYARILYSRSFRRLQGKMQLLGTDHREFYRNRLTHSLEVAQVAGVIAGMLGVDAMFPQACALGHDVGHPPFGHAGEEVLNALLQEYGGYEGNAQTFRILHRLEVHSGLGSGLNLTRRTLLGIVKRHQRRWEGASANAKFMYDDDWEEVGNWWREGDMSGPIQTIDMQIMDLADEITYGAHDLEDCLDRRSFTLDDFLDAFRAMQTPEATEPLLDIVEHARARARHAPTHQASLVLRKQITSRIVNALVRNISLENNRLILGKPYGDLARGLKATEYEVLNRAPVTLRYEQLGGMVIRGLFEVYTDRRFNRDGSLVPAEHRRTWIADPVAGARDAIAAMMDAEAIREYEAYFGPVSDGSLYDGWRRGSANNPA